MSGLARIRRRALSAVEWLLTVLLFAVIALGVWIAALLLMR